MFSELMSFTKLVLRFETQDSTLVQMFSNNLGFFKTSGKESSSAKFNLQAPSIILCHTYYLLIIDCIYRWMRWIPNRHLVAGCSIGHEFHLFHVNDCEMRQTLKSKKMLNVSSCVYMVLISNLML